MKRHYLLYIAIYLLTILDIVFTASGLELGAITEANPLLKAAIQTAPGLTAISVLAYVGAALYFLYKASIKVRWISTAVIGLAGIKACILVLHLGWVSIYLMG